MTLPIDYIKIPASILCRTDMTPLEKMLAGLIKGFNAQGLFMSNMAIGISLGLSAKHIGNVLNQLEQKKLIEIKNSKSKYRHAYFRLEGDVKESQLPPAQDSKNILLPLVEDITSHCKRNITEKNIKNNNIISPQEIERFVKPTPDQVKTYAQSIGYSLDSQSFCDYYEARGWMIGKSKMRNWQAAVRTWKRNQNTYSRKDKLPRITQEVKNDGQYKTITA